MDQHTRPACCKARALSGPKRRIILCEREHLVNAMQERLICDAGPMARQSGFRPADLVMDGVSDSLIRRRNVRTEPALNIISYAAIR